CQLMVTLVHLQRAPPDRLPAASKPHHPLATKAGAVVTEAGGNAIDAAVVAQFVLNVVEPTSSGIGGRGFMGVYLAGGQTFYIDSRE
ncbi:MAG: gamma-glutamyltranspeptidase/glutathione hydrolase, partial [bacterium]